MAELLIDAYLARTAHLPFSWRAAGRVGPDGCVCVSWVCGYIAAATGRDPIAEIAGLSGARAALAELRRRGGIEAAFRAELGPPAAAPVAQGVCLARIGRRVWAGLRNRGRTLLKTDGGVMIGPAPLTSWEI